MVLLITTPSILSALDSLPLSARQSLKLPPPSQSLNSPISHDQLIRLSRSSPTWSLNSLLKGTNLYIPPPPPKPEPSPEYLASKARLLAAAEQDAYNRLIRPSTTALTNEPDSNATSEGQEDQERLTPSLVLNIFLSILITGFSVYFAFTSFRTSEIPIPFVSTNRDRKTESKGMSEPVRVLVSLMVAGVVGVAEAVIYAVYVGKVARAKKREAMLRERKVVVGREEIGGRTATGRESVSAAREEIWGRGVNGGLRRRVRERWEEGEGEN